MFSRADRSTLTPSAFQFMPRTSTPSSETSSPQATTPTHTSSKIDMSQKPLLPDGVQMLPRQVFIQDSLDGQRYLRFDSKLGNLGQGPMQVARNDSMFFDVRQIDMYQIVVNEDGTHQRINMDGQFVQAQHPEHSHLHFADFEQYRLYAATDDNEIGKQIGETSKVSFLIMDIEKIDEVPPLGRVNKSIDDAEIQQGVSAGWADVYGAGIAGQELNITETAPGRYILRQEFDAENHILELHEDNNTLDVLIDISDNGTVTVLGTRYPDRSDEFEMLTTTRAMPPAQPNISTRSAGSPN